MRIEKVDLYRVRLPLVHEFETSSHRKSSIEHIIVRLTDSSGLFGWGEIASPSAPYYGSETVDTAMLIARDYLMPLVVDTSWDHPAELTRRWGVIRGHEFAKAGFDIAAWDLYAATEKMSLSQALGGTRQEVFAGVSLGIEATIDQLLEQIQHQVDEGYSRVKLKIKPGWDVIPVRETRAAFPTLLLHVDANGSYSPDAETSLQMRTLDEFSLAMIEQPFSPRDFISHAELAKTLNTPICLDESIVTTADLLTMVALSAGTVLNIKVSRMGGLTSALAAYSIAREHNIEVWCGGMHEFGIGRAANIALSSLSDFTYPSDVSGSSKYYEQDVIEPEITASRGTVSVPQSVGLGCRVILERIEAGLVRDFT